LLTILAAVWLEMPKPAAAMTADFGPLALTFAAAPLKLTGN